MLPIAIAILTCLVYYVSEGCTAIDYRSGRLADQYEAFQFQVLMTFRIDPENALVEYYREFPDDDDLRQTNYVVDVVSKDGIHHYGRMTPFCRGSWSFSSLTKEDFNKSWTQCVHMELL